MKEKNVNIILIVAIVGYLIYSLVADIIGKNEQGSRAGYISATAKTYHFDLSAEDTLNVYPSDEIVKVFIIVPVGASDSAFVSGNTITIDGFATTYTKVAPGKEIELRLDPDVRIDTLQIAAGDETEVILYPAVE